MFMNIMAMTRGKQKRLLADKLAKDGLSSMKQIENEVPFSRSTIERRFGEMDEVYSVSVHNSPKAHNREWGLDPEEVRDCDYLSDEQIEWFVNSKNILIKELRDRGLLLNPTLDGKVVDFLRENKDVINADMNVTELHSYSDGISAHAAFLFIEIWSEIINRSDRITISGQLQVNDPDVSGGMEMDDMLYSLNDEIKAKIKELPEKPSDLDEE